jgi:hypothetical protein
LQVNSKIMLRGRTRHGKNRIQQHGMEWIITRVHVFKGQPALHLRSVAQTEGPRNSRGFDSRWVLIKNDPDFEIILDK